MAADVLALADAAGAARVHVPAHDWGAAVAWSLAGRHADRLATLSSSTWPPTARAS